VYLKSQDYENAVKNLEESQRLALQMELYEDIINNYLALSVAYKGWGKYDVALEKMEKYSSLKDSIFNAEKHFRLRIYKCSMKPRRKSSKLPCKALG
jgi:tetratricopeptide (TPR) repeat protein